MVRAEQIKSELVDAVIARVHERVTPDKLEIIERFVCRFYATVPRGDMLAASPDRLYGAALAMWQFGAVRPP